MIALFAVCLAVGLALGLILGRNDLLMRARARADLSILSSRAVQHRPGWLTVGLYLLVHPVRTLNPRRIVLNAHLADRRRP